MLLEIDPCLSPYLFVRRRLWETPNRDILEVGVGGNPKVGGFSNLGFYRRGQRIGTSTFSHRYIYPGFILS